MSERISVTVDNEVYLLIQEEKVRERRTESQMAALLIMEALAHRQLDRKAKPDA